MSSKTKAPVEEKSFLAFCLEVSSKLDLSITLLKLFWSSMDSILLLDASDNCKSFSAVWAKETDSSTFSCVSWFFLEL